MSGFRRLLHRAVLQEHSRSRRKGNLVSWWGFFKGGLGDQTGFTSMRTFRGRRRALGRVMAFAL